MPTGTDLLVDEGTSRTASLGFTWRVFGVTAALVAIVVAVALFVASESVRRASDKSARRGLEQSADLVAQFLAGRERSLAGGARVFVQGPYFRTLVSERRRDDILDQTFEAAAQLESQWVFITDGRGVMLAKSDEPGASGDDMSGVPLIAGALRGRVTTGFGVSRDSLLFQAVAVPVEIPGGASIGVLVATKLVDSLLAHDVKVATASELVFFTRDVAGGVHIAASTLGVAAELAKAIRLLADRSATATAGENVGRAPDIRVANVDYLVQRTSLTTAGGDVVGGFVVLRSRDAERASLADVRRSIELAGLLGLLLTLGLAYAAARRVVRPVRTLADAVRRAANGEYALAIRDEVSGSAAGAEVDELADAVDALLADLRDKEAIIAMTAGATVAEHEPDAPVRSGPSAPLRLRRSVGDLHMIGEARAHGDAIAHIGRGVGLIVAPGDILANRYRIERLLGSGGIGMVYRAIDRSLGDTIAIKLLRPEVWAGDPSAYERVKQELLIARRITHRNVVRTHDIGESNGVPFFTMEYVDAKSLADVIHARGALSPSAVVAIAKQLLRALVAAHFGQVVHGDLKPQNLLLGANGVLKVTDFGVARLVRDPQRRNESVRPVDDGSVRRLGGATLGTPEYMAPEQLIGGEATMSSDIYAAGIVLHECLTGSTPYNADTPMAFFARKLVPGAETDTAEHRTARSPLRVLDVRYSAALERLITRMTMPDASERASSAASLLHTFASLR